MSFPPIRHDRGDSEYDIKEKGASITSPMDEVPPQQVHSAHSFQPEERKIRRVEIWTFWTLFLVSIALGVAVSYGILGPMYLQKPFEKELPAGYGSGIYLQGLVNTLSLDSTSMSIQWLIYSCEETGPYAGCNALQDATNFFVDQYASPAASFDPSTAALQYKANFTGYITDLDCEDTSCWDQQLRMGIPYEQTMQTSHSFSIRPAAYNWRANTQAYPFDNYVVHTTFLALDATQTNFTSRKILGVSMTGSVPNFDIQMSSRPVTNDAYGPLEWRMVTIKIARAQIVMGYAFLIWIINWLMTGVVLWITISAVRGKRRIPSDLFGIPITALFALPTVRAIMPGAPFFGCILDYSGIILNLAVLTICSVALLLNVLAREGKEFYSPPPPRPKALRNPSSGGGLFGRLAKSRRPTAENGAGLGLTHLDKV